MVKLNNKIAIWLLLGGSWRLFFFQLYIRYSFTPDINYFYNLRNIIEEDLFFFLFFIILGVDPWHVEVARLGAEPEL